MTVLRVLGVSIVLSLTSLSHAEDWPCWRGPTHDGISTEKNWQSQWDKKPSIAWKASVGTGFSSVVLSDGRLFTMGHADEKDTVFCFDAVTGKKVWSHSYPAELGDKYFEGGTTGTPTVDGDAVYTLSRWGDLFCFESATGKVRWSKNVQKEASLAVPAWGWSGAPLVHGNLLVLNVGAAGLAVNKKTGDIVWASAKDESGYSTPVPFQHGSRSAVLLGTSNAYTAVDATTGTTIWSHRWVTRYGVNAADPIVTPKYVFISTGYSKGATLLERGEDKPNEVWRNKNMKNQMNPSVLLDGFVYGISGDSGHDAELTCLELKTGKVRWSVEGIGTGGVMLADGKLIVLSSKGELMVGKASPDAFKPTGRAEVLDGKCWTVPVLANGRIYCRNAEGTLVCVDVRKP